MQYQGFKIICHTDNKVWHLGREEIVEVK